MSRDNLPEHPEVAEVAIVFSSYLAEPFRRSLEAIDFHAISK